MLTILEQGTMMAKSLNTTELHCAMIQFLIMFIMFNLSLTVKPKTATIHIKATEHCDAVSQLSIQEHL